VQPIRTPVTTTIPTPTLSLLDIATPKPGLTPKPAPAPTPSPEPIVQSKIDGAFTGWDGDSVYKLLNGQWWHQTEYKYIYDYAFNPNIEIFRTARGYEMKVEGVQGSVLVEELKEVIESKIYGQFKGWNNDSIYKLWNGQAWQQAELKLSLSLSLSPDVIIYRTEKGYKMKVEGLDSTVLVRRVAILLESSIDGEFTGWSGDSVYKRMNGQMWQQSEYKYLYRYAWSPSVIICQAPDGYRMVVEGVEGSVRVNRIR
jgi:hypothetical protein